MLAFLKKKLIPLWAHKLGMHIGRRGMFLLFWAFLWLSTGYRWFIGAVPVTNYRLMVKLASVHQWGSTFMALAAVMVMGALWKKMDPLAFALAAWLSSFLCVVTIIGAFALPGDSRITVGTIAFTYFLYALMVYVTSGWPEAASKKKIKRDMNGD